MGGGGVWSIGLWALLGRHFGASRLGSGLVASSGGPDDRSACSAALGRRPGRRGRGRRRCGGRWDPLPRGARHWRRRGERAPPAARVLPAVAADAGQAGRGRRSAHGQPSSDWRVVQKKGSPRGSVGRAMADVPLVPFEGAPVGPEPQRVPMAARAGRCPRTPPRGAAAPQRGPGAPSAHPLALPPPLTASRRPLCVIAASHCA